MDHELLLTDLVTGYRTYAEPADLDVGATTDAPAITQNCWEYTIRVVIGYTASHLGGHYLGPFVRPFLGRGDGQAPGGSPPR